jgi:hypothetical protein
MNRLDRRGWRDYGPANSHKCFPLSKKTSASVAPRPAATNDVVWSRRIQATRSDQPSVWMFTGIPN